MLKNMIMENFTVYNGEVQAQARYNNMSVCVCIRNVIVTGALAQLCDVRGISQWPGQACCYTCAGLR